MTISKNLAKAINEQVKNEMYSANLYLAMAVNFDAMSLSGFADFMYKQAKEEETHAMKFLKYLLDVGETPVISAIPEPTNKFSGGIAMIKASLAHEKKVTAMINNLVEIAEKEKDRASFQFLQWYVSEQVEEESTFENMLKLCEKAGEDKLFLVQGLVKRD